MSFITLIWNATWLVKFVMLILGAASLTSWMMIFQRHKILSEARQDFSEFEQRFWSGVDLSQLFRQISAKNETTGQLSGVEGVFRAGFREFSKLRQQAGADAEAVMEGAQRAMRVALAREEESLNE